jgi:hypothetical protein
LYRGSVHHKRIEVAPLAASQNGHHPPLRPTALHPANAIEPLMPSLTLYHAAPSRSSIVHWMLEEVGEPYDIHL